MCLFHLSLASFAPCNLLCFLFSCLYIPFLFTSPLFFPLRIGLLYSQTRCCKRRVNLGYNLPRFILGCSFFVFDDLYLVDLVHILWCVFFIFYYHFNHQHSRPGISESKISGLIGV